MGHVGEIRLFGGDFAPSGWVICDGALLPIAGNEALFEAIRTTYGGNGVTTFGLPKLGAVLPLHVSSQHPIGQSGNAPLTIVPQRTPLTCIIALKAPPRDDPYLGEVRTFGFNFAPTGWALCDGSALSTANNPALYAVIGNTYGGDAGTFDLPDLRANLSTATESVAPVAGGPIGYLVTNFCIATQGTFPQH